MLSAAFIVSGVNPEGIGFSASCNTLSDATIEGQRRKCNGCKDLMITTRNATYSEAEYPTFFGPGGVSKFER